MMEEHWSRSHLLEAPANGHRSVMSIEVAFLNVASSLKSVPTECFASRKSICKHIQSEILCPRPFLHITNLATTFEDAIRHGYVQDFGRTIPVTRSGKAPSPNDLKIPLEHQGSLQIVVQIILRRLESRELIAVFLRGSFATGHFRTDGSSDIDFFVFSRVPIPQHVKASLRHEISAAVGASLRVCKVDIAFQHARSFRRVSGKEWFNLNSELSILLKYYSVPLFGTLSDIGVSTGTDVVRTHSVRNLPRDKRQFLSAWTQAGEANFELQLQATQWLCKRSLRAGADLFSARAGFHCRDLVPCYHVCSNYLLDADRTILSALQIACALESNNFAGLSRDRVIQIGGHIAWDVAELIEDGFLKSTFSSVTAESADQPQAAPVTISTPSLKKRMLDSAERWFAKSRAWSMPANLFPWSPKCRVVYRRHAIPQVELVANRRVDETGLDGRLPGEIDRTSGGLTHFLHLCTTHPIIVRNALGRNESFKAQTTDQIVNELLDTNLSVTCRLSSENVITFCRGEHAWIEDGTFAVPSRSTRMKTADALKLLRENEDRENVKSPRRPIVYIQTQVRECQRFFRDAWEYVRVAQEERIWISGHGTVSCLHYDAAKSALLQRTGRKRLLFLPPDAIPKLGIYPLGHPLHRRARVSLRRNDSTLFKEFWQTWGKQALEVIVEPGDLLLFPPMWPHYTESLTDSDHELSISHTFRFW